MILFSGLPGTVNSVTVTEYSSFPLPVHPLCQPKRDCLERDLWTWETLDGCRPLTAAILAVVLGDEAQAMDLAMEYATELYVNLPSGAWALFDWSVLDFVAQRSVQ